MVVSFVVRIKNFIGGLVEFWEVDIVGNMVGKVGLMVDDGDIFSFNCDEIDGDGVFLWCVIFELVILIIWWFRISFWVMVNGQFFMIWFLFVLVEIVDSIFVFECVQMQ